MTYQDLRCDYPDKVCICRPHLRDVKSRRVISWHCLLVVDGIDAASVALQNLALDGVTDAVAISTNENITIDGEMAVRYIQVFFGMG